MTSNRWPIFVIVAIVLLAAWSVSRDDLRIGVAVALVGLATTYFRPVLAIPASVAMAAASVYAPGVVAGGIVFAAVAAPFGLLLAFAIKFPGLAGSRDNGGLGMGLGDGGGGDGGGCW